MVTRESVWPEGTPCWVDLGVSEIPKAISFYTALFGWDIPQGPAEMGGYSIATVGGRQVAAVGPKMGSPEAPSAWTVYMATDDADATAARITSAGGQLVMGPMDVMDQGRLAIATDTTGAAFGIWQGRAHTGVQLANVPGSLTWNEHFSRDFEGGKAFYSAVFGYEYGDMSSDQFTYATLLRSGHEVGGIGAYPAETPGSMPSAWNTYFGVADADKSVQRATEAGGSVVRQPADSPYGRVAVVTDDQGAPFSLISVAPAE